MARPDTTKSHECDDWFLTCDCVNRILVVGFDRDVCIYGDHARFLAELAGSCEMLGSDFDVVFWCGPSARAPREEGLACFEALIAKLCCAGARQFGVMTTSGSDVDVLALRRRAQACGHDLFTGDTVDTLEFAFGIGRIVAMEDPEEVICDCAERDDRAAVIEAFAKAAALRLST